MAAARTLCCTLESSCQRGSQVLITRKSACDSVRTRVLPGLAVIACQHLHGRQQSLARTLEGDAPARVTCTSGTKISMLHGAKCVPWIQDKSQNLGSNSAAFWDVSSVFCLSGNVVCSGWFVLPWVPRSELKGLPTPSCCGAYGPPCGSGQGVLSLASSVHNGAAPRGAAVTRSPGDSGTRSGPRCTPDCTEGSGAAWL